MKTTIDAVTGIRRGTDRLVLAVEPMSEAQWMFRLPTGGWSTADVAEHLTISNRAIFNVMSKTFREPRTENVALADDEIPFLFYRGEEPPNVAPPTGAWTDAATTVAAFEASAGALVDWAATTELDLREYGREHPAFGMMDGVQWLLFANAHTERHRAQVIGLQTHPDFPA